MCLAQHQYTTEEHTVRILKGVSLSFLASDGEGIKLQKQTSSNMVLVLLWNKADLTNKRAVDLQEAQFYADDKFVIHGGII